MKQVNQQKLLKQIDRYEIEITGADGSKVYNAADLFARALLNLSRQKNIKRIRCYKK